MTIQFKQQGDGRKSWIIDSSEIVYESPTNKAHNDMLCEILKEKNYLSIGEVSMWVNDDEYGQEAQSIIDWWVTTCKLVEDYIAANPNEETAQEFITTIPNLQ